MKANASSGIGHGRCPVSTDDRESTMSAFTPITAGNQIIRLAESDAEIEAAQRLRYRVFYEKMGAHPLPRTMAEKCDINEFDDACDHLVVLDLAQGGRPTVVGTYRFILSSHAEQLGGFYSAHEYDVAPLQTNGGQIMELGRSCVAADFRNRSTMQLLWRGIAAYVSTNDIDLMFGCASFPGTSPHDLAQPLSYLHHNHLALEHLRARALEDRYSSMHLQPSADVDRRQALSFLPPLIKGYLRAGAFVGDGAVIDRQFNTTDVCIIVKTDLVTSRYAKHYELGDNKPMTQAPPSLRRQAS